MDELVIGETTRGRLQLSVGDRRQHAVLLGQTGTGKSTLLRSLLVQDMVAGRGCGLLDPHGDLAEELLEHVPRWRTDDVVYFHPARLERAPALNPLAAVPPDERHRVVEEVVAVFAAIWGLSPATTPRLLHILTNSVAALLDVPNGASLLGVPRLLLDSGYRERVVRHVRNPHVRGFWEREYAAWPEHQRAEAAAAVLNKAEALIVAPTLANVLGQIVPTIVPERIMDEGRIFIANLAKGPLGETTARLLGALLVASFDLAARRRAARPEAARPDFALYADEFPNFVNERIASLLSEARKYRLALVLAAQYTAALPAAIRAAILGNVGTVIAFRLGPEDAEEIGRLLDWSAITLRELGRGEAVVRVARDGEVGNALLGSIVPAGKARPGRGVNVRRQSEARHTRPRQVIERKLGRWLGDDRSP